MEISVSGLFYLQHEVQNIKNLNQLMLDSIFYSLSLQSINILNRNLGFSCWILFVLFHLKKGVGVAYCILDPFDCSKHWTRTV